MHPETPAQLGYRWPAEWEPQSSVWLSWPRNPATWPGKFEPVPEEFAQLVRTIARFEPVNILAGGREILAQAKSHLHPGGLLVVEIGHNRKALERAFPKLAFRWPAVAAGEGFVFVLRREDL